MDVAEQNVDFSSGDSVTVDDPAVAAQGQGAGGERTVKEFSSEEPFSMFALTWEGERDIATHVRAQNEDGSWGPWYDAEPLSQKTESGRNGTELIYVEPTTKVQVQARGLDMVGDVGTAGGGDDSGAAAPQEQAPTEQAPAEQAPDQSVPQDGTSPEEAPADTPAAPGDSGTSGNGAETAPLPSNYGDIQPVAETAGTAPANPNEGVEVVLIDGNAEAGATAIAPASESDSYGMPDVISRAGWGADESLRCSEPTIDNQVSAITIHHTAGSNNYTEAQAAAQMRGYYTYHASTLGWCDVGYQALVDKYGNIYEGRAGGLNNAVRGAHAGGFNQNTWGISMMGNFQNVTPPRETLQAVGELAGWRASVAGFDPTGTDTHYSEGSSYTMYGAGTAVTLPNIFAHRDVGNTSCPGDAAYAEMDNIRQIAKDKYDSIQGGHAGGASGSSDTGSDTGSTVPQGTARSQSQGGTTPPTTGNGGQNQPDHQATGMEQLSSDVVSQIADGDLDLQAILNGDQETLASAAGTIGMMAVSLALAHGDVGGGSADYTRQLGDVAVIDGVSLSHIPPVVDGLVQLSGNSEIENAWRQVRETFGPVLGDARSGVAYAADQHGNTNTRYALFENGILLNSDQTGPNALWGAIGEAWAGQGFDAGPLGLPVNEEYRDGDLKRVDFQFGYITYDPATGAVDIQLN